MEKCKPGFLKGLFYGVDNENPDLARILVFLSWALVAYSILFKIHTGQDVDIGEAGGALMSVLIGGGVIVGGKDVARSYSLSVGKREPNYYTPFGGTEEGVTTEARY